MNELSALVYKLPLCDICKTMTSYEDLIKTTLDAMRTCYISFYEMQIYDEKKWGECANRCQECGDLCHLTSKILDMESPNVMEYLTLCKSVCFSCATECEKLDFEHCTKCSKATRRCAEACEEMLSMI